MKKLNLVGLIVVALCVTMAIPAQAAEPTNDERISGALVAAGVGVVLASGGSSLVPVAFGALGLGGLFPESPNELLEVAGNTLGAGLEIVGGVIEGAGNIISGVFALFGN